ncbi:MAG TPA: DoxX family protein [Ktedonobacterales bacterium]|jgi:putative oxidoreductase|nr:DoxX family protein [Ktedonobacterales bacterium]
MVNLALLVLRVTAGSLLAGHGAQKLFGWFGGSGQDGTAKWLESMGLKPGKGWAIAAGGSEFGGGLLMILGFLNPLGPLSALGSMGMATATAHRGKPIWVTSGGAELPVTNAAITTALMLAGPGDISLDRALGTKLPRWVLIPGLAAVCAGVAAGVMLSNREQQAAQDKESGAASQADREAVPSI